MNKQTDQELLEVLVDIRNWIRAASHEAVKAQLESALPNAKSRAVYQMLDGTKSIEQVRIACKISPNALLALANRCESMGLMSVNSDRKRVRLFDLVNFGLLESDTAEAVKND